MKRSLSNDAPTLSRRASFALPIQALEAGTASPGTDICHGRKAVAISYDRRLPSKIKRFRGSLPACGQAVGITYVTTVATDFDATAYAMYSAVGSLVEPSPPENPASRVQKKNTMLGPIKKIKAYPSTRMMLDGRSPAPANLFISSYTMNCTAPCPVPNRPGASPVYSPARPSFAHTLWSP